MRREKVWCLKAMLMSLTLVSATHSALAANPALPGIGNGVRHVIDVAREPWRVMGRVQTELGAKCTGFMVAPSVIQTAAHCLWREAAGNYVQPASVHFLLGYDTGSWRASAKAVRFIIPAGYDPYHPLRTSQADHATIILDHPLITSAELLPMVSAETGQKAMLAGYQQDRIELASGDLNCHIIGLRGHLVDHDCAATHGVSGAPLLVVSEQGWGIAGIDVTARDDQGGTAVSLKDPESAEKPIINK